MKHSVVIAVLSLFGVFLQGQGTSPLKLTEKILLPSAEGRIDHLTVDLKTQKLFIAALVNNTVEVVDLAQGKRVRSITGLNEPQGIVIAPDLNRVYVANGGDGMLRTYDSATLATGPNLKLGADADNVRYDSATGTIVVGYGAGALGLVDAKTVKSTGAIKLSGHPESFQLDKSNQRIYVNVPDANHIAVLDRSKLTVTTTWPLNDLHANFPMAIDEANHRLFVAMRNPARLAVLDTTTGKLAAVLPCSSDADDVFYDSQNKRIYVAAGEGFIDVFRQPDADHYSPLVRVPTAAGARTALFVPEMHRFFLAVPHRGTQAAAIYVYEVAN
jgi:DNA-binding beta-propeller fold protein YncE